jgi:hypothetical protein
MLAVVADHSLCVTATSWPGVHDPTSGPSSKKVYEVLEACHCVGAAQKVLKVPQRMIFF